MEIELTFSNTENWGPLPWPVYEVEPLFDRHGNVMAYCERLPYRGTLGSLPTEVFNHQLRDDADPSNPLLFASFMSGFGLLGTPQRRDRRVAAIMDVETEEQARSTDRLYGFLNVLDPAARYEERLPWYQDMQRAAEAKGLGWRKSDDSLNDLFQTRAFVTAYDAARTRELLIEGVKVVVAFLKYEDSGDIARFLEMPEDQVFDHIADCVSYLNWLLEFASPQMGARPKDGAPEAYLPIAEEHEIYEREGCLAAAIAHQIYRLTKGGGNYRECKECGTVFVERQTAGRKGSSRSTASFCCTRCKNRHMQRRYRERHRKDNTAPR